jgi:hypothetical protein
MADPRVLDTIGPMACIKTKFEGLYSWATFWETLAAIGIAETPAFPIIPIAIASLMSKAESPGIRGAQLS